VNMELEYLATASFTEDLQIIMRTIGRIFVPQSAKDGFLKQQLAVVGSSLSREAGNAEKSPAQAPPSREQPLEEASRSAVAGD